jgi:hypothetical protein
MGVADLIKRYCLIKLVCVCICVSDGIISVTGSTTLISTSINTS